MAYLDNNYMVGYARGLSLGPSRTDKANACLAEGSSFTILGTTEDNGGLKSAFLAFANGAAIEASLLLN